MPCYDPRDSGRTVTEYVERPSSKQRNVVADLEKEITRLNKLNKVKTRHLCYMSGVLRGAGLYDSLPESILHWTDVHHSHDEVRVVKAIKELRSENPSASAESIANVLIAKAELEHPVSDWHKEWFLEMVKKEAK